MLNFQRYLYKNIGNRIKKHRIQLELNQTDFISYFQVKYHIHLDRNRLSSIENGRNYIYKNPYLLTAEQIEIFSEDMECIPKELIFGDYEERERSVKLVLLAIIMNSEKIKENGVEEYIIPFIDNIFETKNSREILFAFNNYLEENDKEKERILKPIHGLEEETAEKEGVNIILEWFKNEYPFFTSSENVENYKNIAGESSPSINFISNLLIKLLVGNIGFAEFLSRKLRGALNNNSKSNYSKLDLSSFNKNIGQHGGILVRSKDGFYLFVHAFNEMWERHKKVFMEYFESSIFSKENSTSRYKYLNNDLFHNVITSSELSNIVFTLIENEKFTIESIDGHYLFYRSMYEMAYEKILHV
ncbi:hypothetical protein [Virgibacillus salinus]|uniref:Uncharacterized protein n=1 Tax=Virgibacillus salinus TaxID=553311 RepID=A0A1H1GNR3_9BACI|nr:hypothetical protein [Virgibacillus salinus]SDR14516.1 hypothetical protein SAMN05216231_3768 [Virgibacillus salinus]